MLLYFLNFQLDCKLTPGDPDYVQYSSLINELINSKTRSAFENSVENLKNYASAAFVNYVINHKTPISNMTLVDAIRNHSADFVTTKYPVFNPTYPTNNDSESFNSVIKDFEKLRLEVLVYRLLNLQINRYLYQFNATKLNLSPCDYSRKANIDLKNIPTLNLPSKFLKQNIKQMFEEAQEEFKKLKDSQMNKVTGEFL